MDHFAQSLVTDYPMISLAESTPLCEIETEDCQNVIEVTYKVYGVKNLGWSSLFKTLTPDVIAWWMLLSYMSDNDIDWPDLSDDEDCE